MAVLVLRSVRHLLFKEMPALTVTVVPSRLQSSGLPPVKTQTIDNTILLRYAAPPTQTQPEPITATADQAWPQTQQQQQPQRPLVVLFGWMLAKQRHLNKYGNLYLSKGFDVLSIKVPPSQVLWPVMAQKRIDGLLNTLQESSLASRPLLIHGFSVGAYLYGEMLVKLASDPKYKQITDRIVGQVFDSPVDLEGVPRGFAIVLARGSAMQAVMRTSLECYLKVMHNSVTKHYQKSSAAFHSNSLQLPSLFLYSRADPIGVADIIEGVMHLWRERGIAVSNKCWDHSPHVSHFHHHPDEYVDNLLTFLDSLGLCSPEQQELEKEVLSASARLSSSSTSSSTSAASSPLIQQQQQQQQQLEVPSRK